jgi:hypothetical protein
VAQRRHSKSRELYFFSIERETILITAVKRVEFVNNRMSCIVLRGRWFNIIVLNMHAPYEEKR